MSEALKRGLTLIGVPEYLDRLLSAGFESWHHFLLITDEDLIQLRIPAAHRRLLRKLISLCQLSRDERILQASHEGKQDEFGGKAVAEGSGRKKRKYRRHPKPDGNAPKRPHTAYVTFMLEKQHEIGPEVSFVSRAKEVAKAWQILSDEERGQREQVAQAAFQSYRDATEKYKQTEQYRNYSKYVKDFKADEAKTLSFSAKEVSKQDDDLAPVAREVDGPSIIEVLISHRYIPDSGSNKQTVAEFDTLLQSIPFTSRERQTIQRMLEQSIKRQNPTIDDHRPEKVTSLESQALAVITNEHTLSIMGSTLGSGSNKAQFSAEFPTYQRMFFFFDAVELVENYRLAYSTPTSLSNRQLSETCLVLAIGSNWNDAASQEDALMWYENGRRYLDADHWDRQLWVMRMLALICVYHIGARPDTAEHYLRMAIRIAKLNGFLDGTETLSSQSWMQTWLLVWNTIKILYSYFESNISSKFVDTAELDLDFDIASSPTWEIAQRYPVQSCMVEISRIIHSVTLDVLYRNEVPLETYEYYIEQLQTWSFSFTKPVNSMYISSQDELTSSSDLFAEFHRVLLYYNGIMLLTLPVLLKAIHRLTRSELSAEVRNMREDRIIDICIESSFQVTKLSQEHMMKGLLSPKAWLAMRCNYYASIIGALARTRAIRLEQCGLISSTKSALLVEAGVAVLRESSAILRFCAAKEEAVAPLLENIARISIHSNDNDLI